MGAAGIPAWACASAGADPPGSSKTVGRKWAFQPKRQDVGRRWAREAFQRPPDSAASAVRMRQQRLCR
jgi:hypothetical protein